MSQKKRYSRARLLRQTLVFASLAMRIATPAQAQQVLWEPAGSVSGAVQCLGVTTSNIVYAGTDSGLYVSSDHGDTWQNIADPPMGTGVTCLLITTDEELFAGTKTGLFHWRIIDASWEKVFSSTAYTWVTAMVEGRNGEIFIGAADTTGLAGSIFHSLNGLGGWTEIDSLLIGEDVAFAFIADTSRAVFVLTNGGGVIQRNVFYAWDGLSHKWDQVCLFSPVLEIQALICDKKNNFWGAEAHGVTTSTDRGVTWLARDMYPNTCFAIDIWAGDERAVVGTFTRGVFYTDDGWNWTEASSGFPLNPVFQDERILDPIFALKYDHEGRLFAGTRDFGVYRSSQLATGVRESGGRASIAGFRLGQNYPNPFNSETTIPFTVKERGSVDIRVFNLLGQEVAVLFDDVVGSGEHSVRWNASEYPSGMYLVRMTAGVHSSSERIILLK